jgi:hypothetical protein
MRTIGMDEFDAMLDAEGLQTFVGLSVVRGGRLRCVLCVASNRLDEFPRAVQATLANLSRRMGGVLTHIQAEGAFRESEQALRQRERQLATAAEIAQLGYWEYDVATDRFTFNDQ